MLPDLCSSRSKTPGYDKSGVQPCEKMAFEANRGFLHSMLSEEDARREG